MRSWTVRSKSRPTIGGFIAAQIDQGVSLEEIQKILESQVRRQEPGTSNIQERGF